MPTLLISSTNYNGQLGDITFYPDTGGTFNLGYQLIPYYYVADYIYLLIGVMVLYPQILTPTEPILTHFQVTIQLQ